MVENTTTGRFSLENLQNKSLKCLI